MVVALATSAPVGAQTDASGHSERRTRGLRGLSGFTRIGARGYELEHHTRLELGSSSNHVHPRDCSSDPRDPRFQRSERGRKGRRAPQTEEPFQRSNAQTLKLSNSFYGCTPANCLAVAASLPS